MNRRFIPGFIALWVLACVVLLASTGPAERLPAIANVTGLLVLALFAHWALTRGGVPSGSPSQSPMATAPAVAGSTHAGATADEPEPSGDTSSDESSGPTVVSSYEPGGGLYYLRNTSAGSAVNVFVIGTDAGGAITVLEVGALAAQQSTLLSIQGLASRRHVVVTEAGPSDARQWSAMTCERSPDGFYIRASPLSEGPQHTERMTFAAYRERYLRDAEQRLLAGSS